MTEATCSNSSKMPVRTFLVCLLSHTYPHTHTRLNMFLWEIRNQASPCFIQSEEFQNIPHTYPGGSYRGRVTEYSGVVFLTCTHRSISDLNCDLPSHVHKHTTYGLLLKHTSSHCLLLSFSPINTHIYFSSPLLTRSALNFLIKCHITQSHRVEKKLTKSLSVVCNFSSISLF